MTPEAELRSALAKANEKHALGDKQSRRSAAENALIAMMDYLMLHRGIELGLLHPVRELLISLNSLNFGNEDPIFRPTRSGKPKLSPRREQLREVVAVAISVLMDGGMGEQKAQKKVANALRSLQLDV
jgi:hypothetical protein